jgi:hypothetical protein
MNGRSLHWPLGKNNMTQITNNPIHKLHKAPQPALSHPGATPDSDRAKKPPLAEPAATDQELNPGDRVEGLGDFGKPTGASAQLSKLTTMTRSSNGMMTGV